MTLITLLIALTIERIAATAEAWQFDFYYVRYKRLATHHFRNATWLNHSGVLCLWVLLPTLGVWLISQTIDWLLFDFIFNLLVLLVCIGCLDKRQLYKSFLNAANRGDEEGCQLYAEQLKAVATQTTADSDTETKTESESETEAEAESEAESEAEAETEARQCRHSLGLTLVWYNFKYYCAVLFWFVCLGPAGAVLYCMARQTSDDQDQDTLGLFNAAGLSTLMHWLDWLPARVCSAGYLLIGDFNRSAGIWLSYLLNFRSPARELLSEIAEAAESVEVDESNKTLEPTLMLKLAKRNVLFFLALVALLTLYGGIA